MSDMNPLPLPDFNDPVNIIHCEFRSPSGVECPGPTLPNSTWCAVHHPDINVRKLVQELERPEPQLPLLEGLMDKGGRGSRPDGHPAPPGRQAPRSERHVVLVLPGLDIIREAIQWRLGFVSNIDELVVAIDRYIARHQELTP